MDDDGAVAVERVASSPREHTDSALEHPTADGLPAPLIDPNDLLAGDPPPDGIPPSTSQSSCGPRPATFLENHEPVLAIKVRGEARALRIQIMTWNEIVNDAPAAP